PRRSSWWVFALSQADHPLNLASTCGRLSLPAGGAGRAQLAWQGEDQVLRGGGDLFDVGVAPLGEQLKHTADEDLRHGGARGHSDVLNTLKPLRLEDRKSTRLNSSHVSIS